ncbi:MAG: hypothetical protein ABIG42_00415 [bacterium]
MSDIQAYRYRSILGIVGGISLGYIFALDVTGWYYLTPSTLILLEVIGALVLFRITHGLLQDDKISSPVKRGYVWAVTGLIIAHILTMGYIYLDDLQASFNIDKIDFAESLMIGWSYFHFTMLGFIFGALFEYIHAFRKRKREIRRQARLKNAQAKIESELLEK